MASIFSPSERHEYTSGCATSFHFIPVPLIMRLISPGKIEIAFEGRRMSSVIFILKFSQQHHPQRAHEKPELRISWVKTDEWVWIILSILRRSEAMSMNKHREDMDICLFQYGCESIYRLIPILLTCKIITAKCAKAAKIIAATLCALCVLCGDLSSRKSAIRG